MIAFFHPRSTRPRNRRFPLSILSLAAVIEGREDYEIVDGNVDADPLPRLDRLHSGKGIELLAVSVMPGPQMVAAISVCRDFRNLHPSVPIVWGGYFPSLYPDATLNAPYVDFAVRGQGEDTLREFLAALRAGQGFSGVKGLSYKDENGKHLHNPERVMRSPENFPWFPYYRLDASKYVLPTFLGSRTAVHQASVGCPFHCNFCGVISVYGSREKMEPAERTVAVLKHLQERYGVNAVQFYDNNFFLREDHAAELAHSMVPLKLRWWCEGRIDTVLGYADETLKALKESGCTMIFFGAESGSDWVLREMRKNLRTDQTLALAGRIRRFGIIPEFSFVVGNPGDPERDSRECIAFVRKLKNLNPAAEIILQHYIPTPQRDGMYGSVEGRLQFPDTPEEWATERWYNFTVRKDPRLEWLPESVRRRIDDFETVVNARWPTAQDTRLPGWGKRVLQALGSWRYRTGVYAYPKEVFWAQRILGLRQPKVESL